MYDENRNQVGGFVMGRKLVAYFSASGAFFGCHVDYAADSFYEHG